MALEAELITSSERWKPSVRRDVYGVSATRYYKVNTGDVMAAAFAVGMPKPGDPWGGPYAPANLRVRGHGEPELLSANEDGSGEAGWVIVPVEYATPEARGGLKWPTGPGDQWTEEAVGLTQVNVIVSKERRLENGDVYLGEEPINNGDGMDLDFGLLSLRVYTFRPLGLPFADLPRLMDLMQPAKLNDQQISTPPLYGTTSRLTFQPKQLLYVGFERQVVGDFLQVVHVLKAQANFNKVWRVYDDLRNPTGPIVADRGNETASFANLWQ